MFLRDDDDGAFFFFGEDVEFVPLVRVTFRWERFLVFFMPSNGSDCVSCIVKNRCY